MAFGARGDYDLFTRTSVKREDLFNDAAFEAGARTSSYPKSADQNSIEHRLKGTYTRGTTSSESITVNGGAPFECYPVFYGMISVTPSR